MEKYDEIVNILKKKGYKLTPQRIEIIRLLTSLSGEHPTLDSLLKKVKETIPTMSISTLYSTILKLEELGVIKTVYIQGKIRVELNNYPHINVIESKTGKITDVTKDDLINEIKRLLSKMGKDTDDFIVNIIIY